MQTRWNIVVLVAASSALTAVALGGDTPEVEPNELKSNATPVSGPVVPGDTLSGSSTGSASTAGSAASRDFFRITVAATAPGIHRNRLTITTVDAHAGAIMGVPQSGSASDTTTVQTSSNKLTQWYSFGAEHRLNYRVIGTSSTMAPYSAMFGQSSVSPTDLGAFQPGPFTITTIGQGHATDTEIFLYDANFNLVRSNDDRPSPPSLQSSITHTLGAGRYFLAISTFNLAPDVANEPAATEASIFGERMDFPGAIARAGSTSNVNVAFAITDNGGTRTFPAVLPAAFDVYFATLTVGAPCPSDITGDGVVNSTDLSQVLGAWGAGAGPADITQDGVVNSSDLGQVLGAWGPCPG